MYSGSSVIRCDDEFRILEQQRDACIQAAEGKTIMRTLGKSGPSVSDVGLGCMGMSDLYGPADDTESKATIHAALDPGVTLLDTGDYYGMGHNELLLRDALTGRNRQQVVISVKCGALRDPKGNWLGVDGRPAAVKTFLA